MHADLVSNWKEQRLNLTAEPRRTRAATRELGAALDGEKQRCYSKEEYQPEKAASHVVIHSELHMFTRGSIESYFLPEKSVVHSQNVMAGGDIARHRVAIEQKSKLFLVDRDIDLAALYVGRPIARDGELGELRCIVL